MIDTSASHAHVSLIKAQIVSHALNLNFASSENHFGGTGKPFQVIRSVVNGRVRKNGNRCRLTLGSARILAPVGGPPDPYLIMDTSYSLIEKALIVP